MKIHAFGDSFVVGDQDDFYDDPNTVTTPTHGMNFGERLNYLKYNVSFAVLISKQLGVEFVNYAERGSGNYPQLDKLWMACFNKKIVKDDIVLFGMTTTARDRAHCGHIEKVISSNYGEFLVDRNLINICDHSTIGVIDQFYILSILEKLMDLFQIRIIAFNLFDNPNDYSNVKNNFFECYLGNNVEGNTLIDIINDTWGLGFKNPYHEHLKVPSGYENFYTHNKHPSIEGHQKIASWFLKYVKF